MSYIERRKAFLQFVGEKSCTITTPFRQKTFDVEPGMVVDLYTLKRLRSDFDAEASPPCPFYVMFDKHGDFILGKVFAVIDVKKQSEPWGTVWLRGNKEALFEGKVWTG